VTQCHLSHTSINFLGECWPWRGKPFTTCELENQGQSLHNYINDQCLKQGVKVGKNALWNKPISEINPLLALSIQLLWNSNKHMYISRICSYLAIDILFHINCRSAVICIYQYSDIWKLLSMICKHCLLQTTAIRYQCNSTISLFLRYISISSFWTRVNMAVDQCSQFCTQVNISMTFSTPFTSLQMIEPAFKLIHPWYLTNLIIPKTVRSDLNTCNL